MENREAANMSDMITFSFGKNWQEYLHTVSDNEIKRAQDDIEKWLGAECVSGKDVIEIGSGSGIHSFSFWRLHAKTIYSFDYDKYSVEATKTLWEKAGKPENWTVSEGSVLDKDYLRSLGKFDIVYSWGVLHHTGAMWEAMENSFRLVKPGGKIWISLYAKGSKYPKHLALKRKYNSASDLMKRWMIYTRISKIIFGRILRFQNPFEWNRKIHRGMNVYHNIVDWLGGLPYEVASEDEVLTFGGERGFVLERINVKREGGCSIYVFSLPE